MAAKRATKTAKIPKAAEPFFHPFARLAADDKKKKKAKGEVAPPDLPSAPKSAAKRAGKSVPAPPPAIEAAPSLVDARSFAIYMSGVRALPERASRIPLTASGIERARGAATPLP